ncbi:MAG: FkbM family methyltransferase, partial [Steroidobacteraceae bacterium]
AAYTGAVRNDRPVKPSRPILIEHPWPRRLMRTVQFGLARIGNRSGYLEARAAPFDLTFVGPAADCITRHIYRFGAHEPDITRYVIDHVRLGPGEIAIDVGANLGWYSVLLTRLSDPGARIFAFEPDPETYGLLCRNLATNGASAVTAVNAALGETAGSAVLHRYRSRNNGRHTLVPGADARGGSCEVPVQTLDSFCESQGLGGARVRFLKIDVEGFEYFVLRGATHLLRRCDCVLLELNPVASARELLDWLAGTGLSVHAFRGGRLVPTSLAALMECRTQVDLILQSGRAAG